MQNLRNNFLSSRGLRPMLFLLSSLFFFSLLFFAGVRVEATDLVFSAADFGANGSDKADDTTAVQACLDQAKTSDVPVTVKIPSGTYYFSQSLIIYSDTTLLLEDDTVMLRTDLSVPLLCSDTTWKYEGSPVGGYDQVENIVISGGTWNGGASTFTSSEMMVVLLFHHGKNITLSHCEVCNSSARHIAVFGGVKDCIIEDVTFRNMYYYTGTSSSYYDWTKGYNTGLRTMEALHLDCISDDGDSEGTAYPLDNTVCQNITVRGCHFENVWSGVGGHYMADNETIMEKKGLWGSNFVYENNTFTDVKYTCIDAYGHKGVTITGNTADDVGEFVRSAWSDLTLNNNSVQFSGYTSKSLRLYGALFQGCGEVSLCDNNFQGGSDHMINLDSTETITLENNTLTNPGSFGIRISGGCAFLKGNTISGAGDHGIWLEGVSVSAESNTVTSSGSYGIFAKNDSIAYLHDNLVTSAASCGIGIADSAFLLRDNTISGAGTFGIYITGGTQKTNDVKTDPAGIIQDTIITNSGNCGIYVKGSPLCKLVVAGNTVSSSQGTAGILFKTDNQISVTLSDCKVSSSSGYGIYAYHLLNSTLTENTVRESGSTGVYFTGCQETVFQDNMVSQSGGNDILAADGSGTIADNWYGAGGCVSQSSSFILSNNRIEPDAPRFSSLTSTKEGVLLQWAELDYADSVEIYRKTDGEFTLLTQLSLPATSYVDTDVSEGNEYTYTLLACSGIKKTLQDPAGQSITYCSSEFFTVYYHSEEGAIASSVTSEVVYGVITNLETVDTLGFEGNFKGWKVYRESDNKWYLKNESGKKSWQCLAPGGSLPVGYTYVLYADGANVAKTAPVGSAVHLYAQWKTDSFTVYYHASDVDAASPSTSRVSYGVTTQLQTVSTLGFEGYFKGWRVYREYDNKWYLKNDSGEKSWQRLNAGGSLPAGWSYVLYADGANVAKTAPAGSAVHLYAQWQGTDFRILYHSSDSAIASSTTTIAPYEKAINLLTADTLGFQGGAAASFRGWKVYRESDNKWYMQNSAGETSWEKLTPGGSLPVGYTYALYADGAEIKKSSLTGSNLHLYAQWNSPKFTVYYHENDFAPSLSSTTLITYGSATPLPAVSTLGCGNATFRGWKLYREIDNKWYLKNADGKKAWKLLNSDGSLPSGWTYVLYADKTKVAKTVPAGTSLHLYAQWTPAYFTVAYHEDNTSPAMSTVTRVTYGVSTQVKTTSSLKLTGTFTGWRVYRESDNKWYLKDSNGKKVWMALTSDGELPQGYSYVLYKNGATVAKTAPAGTTVHLYAQWE